MTSERRTSSSAVPRTGIWHETGALLAGSMRLVRAGGAKLLALLLASQLIIVAVALPVIGWLFREALRAVGMHGLDMGQLQLGRGFPLTVALIIAIITIAFWLIALQFTALVVLLRWPKLGGRAYLRELGRVARKLVHPGAAPLVFYLFLLVPLTGFGFTSVFTRGIAIPSFVSGELEKSTVTAIVYSGVLLLLALLNIRLAPTVPVFVLTTGGKLARSSWRLTRGLRSSMPMVLAVVAVVATGGFAGGLLTVAAVVPTAISDAVAPDASYVVAAYSLGIAQAVGFMLSGIVTALVAGVLITLALRGAERLPAGVALVSSSAGSTAGSPDGALPAASPPLQPRYGALRSRSGAFTAIGLVAVAAVTGTLGIGTMQQLSNSPETLVLAHRGFTDGGVENTISGLEAAHAAGADLVEMDVMQTQDGEFVAMHDASLSRLAGKDVAVKDLTLDELTAITVHDRFGHEDRIPSFAEYVERAAALEMPLLVEIKLSGAETPDHVDRLVAELETLGALDQNIYHSLDAPSVERLKHLRPDTTVGYTMAFAAVDVPDTPADFIVVEEWTATEKMQRAAIASGYGFMAWTVNDENGMREHLRRGTDGIISDHPDEVLALRDEMQQQTGLMPVLADALSRFVTII
ncbi:glycerophosphodiester phosphodiesterase family protein [Leucobacter sp. gxy201]|uniref:glycerophosphodiester phosphodiesterase family protein n=1 Tax=Leucobacter sp. gxy201 TaxID=2957200 RepID=UPI003DA17D17